MCFLARRQLPAFRQLPATFFFLFSKRIQNYTTNKLGRTNKKGGLDFSSLDQYLGAEDAGFPTETLLIGVNAQFC
jgi:hypothetical protein